MSRHTILSSMAACICFAAAASAQTAHTVFFRGPQAGFGIIEERDLMQSGPASFPLGTLPIHLLPLEVNGRTELTRTDIDQAWRQDDVPGASRISLPAAQGSLFHYEESHGATSRVFGLFWIDAAGRARKLIERKGTGPAIDQDPFLARVGAAKDGSSILCATTLAGGGDLLEIDLGSGVVIDRTASQAPIDWLPQSLFLAPQWGIAMHTAGVQTFSRTPAAQSAELNFGGAPPPWFSGDVALAPLGGYAAFVAGTSPQAADVFVVSSARALARATPLPAAVSPAGYLPESIDGPYLGVSDDGGLCAWRTEGLTREAYLSRVPWQAAGAAVQLTASPDFTDTIDEVGQFIFRASGGLLFTAGERATPVGGIDKIDVFSAALPVGASTAVMANLSQSSGILTPPFSLPGAIKPAGAFTLPSASGRILLDLHNDELVLLPAQGGTEVMLLANVKTLDDVACFGTRCVLVLQRTGAGQPHQLVAWDASAPLSVQVLFSSASASGFAQLSLRADRCAFLENAPAGDKLQGCDLLTGNIQLFSTRNFVYGPALAFAANGELTTSIGGPLAPAAFVRWQLGSSPARLGPINGPGFVLRGL